MYTSDMYQILEWFGKIGKTGLHARETFQNKNVQLSYYTNWKIPGRLQWVIFKLLFFLPFHMSHTGLQPQATAISCSRIMSLYPCK